MVYCNQRSVDIFWQVKNTKEGCRGHWNCKEQRNYMLSFKYIYCSLARGLKNKHCFPRQHGRELDPSLDHWLVQAIGTGFTFFYWGHIKFFKDQTPQTFFFFFLRKLKLSVVFMRQFSVSSIPVITSSLQEVICNIFLEERLVRHIKVSRMSRMDLWTESCLPWKCMLCLY